MKELERIVPQELPWYYRHLYREHIARYRLASRKVRGKVVVDAACGSGYGSKCLADAGARIVIGVDNSQEAIRYAMAQYGCPSTQYVVGDVTRAIFQTETIDVVVCFETIEHLVDYESCIAEVCRIMKRDGTLWISTPNASVSYMPSKYHIREFTFQEFRDLLAKHFSKLSFYGQRPISSTYLNYLRKLRLMMPQVPLWIPDAILRVLFFSSPAIYSAAVRSREPMIYLAKCQK